MLLAGCSSSPSKSDGDQPNDVQGIVYDFTQVNGIQPANEITFTFSDELLEMAKADGVNPLVTSVKMTGRKLPGSMCAADAEYTYADGGIDVLKDASGETNPIYDGKTPHQIVAGRLTGVTNGDDRMMDEFDESNPEKGTYISDDFTTATIVNTCAKSPTDHDRDVQLHFPHENTYPGFAVHFAKAYVTLTNDGTIGVVEGEVKGYQPDSNGDWIR